MAPPTLAGLHHDHRRGERDGASLVRGGAAAGVAWSSLAGGFFSGRFRRDNLDTFTDYLDRLSAEVYGTEENFRDWIGPGPWRRPAV